MTRSDIHVQVYERRVFAAGSCNSCKRSRLYDAESPEFVTEITLGNNSTISVRLCADCLAVLKEKLR